MASKFGAFQDRGVSDPRLSEDLEDICVILSSTEVARAIVESEDAEVVEYISDQLRQLVNRSELREAVFGHLEDSQNAEQVFDMLESLLKVTQ